MILNLQSFDEEAGPLSEMIELAREHAEFTKPILDLLNQLVSKLLAERDVITKAVSSAKVAHTEAQSASATNCDRREVKRIERANAQAAFNAETSARSGAQQEFNDIQALWLTTRSKTESAFKRTQRRCSLSPLSIHALSKPRILFARAAGKSSRFIPMPPVAPTPSQARTASPCVSHAI